jgi:tRNA G18 (ribose-2'-O)-methylase SpoU
MRKLLNEELDRLDVTSFKGSEKIPVVVILDNVRSMNNIGSVFRTADAFRIEKIFLCGITATPPNKEIHKTALGSTESVDWAYYADTSIIISELKSNGYLVLAVEQTDGGISLEKMRLDRGAKYALVFGHEVKGVAQEIVNQCHSCIEIPQFGTKHSLNISVAAGIVLWEFFIEFQDFLSR